MNTIKIYLAEDGSIATLSKDFDLYQYEYQNKLLNVYVPISICAGPFVDNNITTGYSCQLKMKATSTTGAEKITGSFYMRYVKTLTYNSVEYALFERLLPYAFTIYSGVDENAPQLTISVVNIDLIEEDGVTTPTILSVTNSQTCALEVNPSTSVQSETIEDASELDTLEALYGDIITTLAEKQNADTTDDTDVINIDGNDHTVVGNINSLLTDVANNADDIDDLQEASANQALDIANLYNLIEYSINLVGSITLNDLDLTDEDDLATAITAIEAYVLAQTGSTPTRGMAVIVYIDNSSDTDTLYYFIYDGSNWNFFEMQFLNSAENGVKGLVEGNYTNNGLLTPDNLMTSITNGDITNIYRVDADGNYTTIKIALDQVIAKLINGTSAVNMATKDANGNNIVNTYLTQASGATKTYVQNYASPKALYDINYCDYATGAFVDSNVNDSSYEKTTTSSAIGYTTLATLTKSLEADILLGDQNGTTNTLWIASTLAEDVKLRITTAYYDDDTSAWVNLSDTETDTISLTAGTYKKLTIESVFDSLNDNITLASGTNFRQIIEVYREVSTSCDFTLSSNTTYLAYMEFNKIGFVRYSLEASVDGLTMGNDTSTTDGDGNLVVSGEGEIEYENGNTDAIDTQFKIPSITPNLMTIDTSVVQNSTNVITGGAVYTALEDKLDIPNGLYDFDTGNGGTTYTYPIIPVADATIDENTGEISAVSDVKGLWFGIGVQDYAFGIPSSSQVYSAMALKMAKANPSGTGTLAINGTASGTNSVALGDSTNATGGYSMAVNRSTTASGYGSLANGFSTNASGYYSHAEGQGTQAVTKSQHTSGEFNVLDTNGSNSSRGDFVEIVGNGSNTSSRSNARALDWSGNEYLKGDLYVGCDSNSANGTKVKVWTTDTTSTTTPTLADHKILKVGTQSSLTINDASEYPLDFECELVFTLSTTSINYSALNITWRGVNVSSNVFTPEANTQYNIFFFNNSRDVNTPDLQAIVSSDAEISSGGGGGVTPANYITEEYTSGDWKVRKWSNGECELWASISKVSTSFSSWGNVYVATVNSSTDIAYPVTFASVPLEQCTIYSGSTAYTFIPCVDKRNTTINTGAYSIVRATTASTLSVVLNIYVKGTLS